jgi:hypothetical protein
MHLVMAAGTSMQLAIQRWHACLVLAGIACKMVASFGMYMHMCCSCVCLCSPLAVVVAALACVCVV